MKAIFIGSIYPEDVQKRLIDLGSGIDNAAHTFQTALLSGLEKYYDEINVITVPNISSYPRCKKILFRKKNFESSISNRLKCVFVGLINLPIVKLFSKYFRIKRYLKSILSAINEETIIYVYGVHSPFLKAVCDVAHPRAKTCLIVPDLPEFMSSNRNPFYLFAKKLDKFLINSCVKRFDSFVLLSPFMKERLPIDNKPWIQMEGIYQVSEVDYVKKNDCIIIAYTGSLDKRYGILDLLKAFSLIKKDNYRLVICGSGNSELEIIKAQKLDKRICFLGILPRLDTLKLQKEATLLVNPRHSKEEYTKYSFPSKTMEYMASGIPTVMFPLKCIPDEYNKYLFFFEDESICGMRDKLVEICEMSCEERAAFGKAASDFIVNEKNAVSQAQRIVSLIHSL